jgi:hypothetical protein
MRPTAPATKWAKLVLLIAAAIVADRAWNASEIRRLTAQVQIASSAPAARVRAVGMLGLMRRQGAPAVPTLVECLRSGDPEVRKAAMLALGEIGRPAAGAVPELQALLDDEEPAVRLRAAFSLGRIVNWDAALPTLSAGLGDPDPRVREHAAALLADVGRPAAPAVPALMERLHDEDDGVVFWAEEALREIAQPAVTVLASSLADESPEVRACAAEGLRVLGNRAAAGVPGLTKCLRDADPRVRRSAALALAAIGRPAAPAVPELRRLLEDEDAYVRAAAGDALCAILGGSFPAMSGRTGGAFGRRYSRLRLSATHRGQSASRAVALWALIALFALAWYCAGIHGRLTYGRGGDWMAATPIWAVFFCPAWAMMLRDVRDRLWWAAVGGVVFWFAEFARMVMTIRIDRLSSFWPRGWAAVVCAVGGAVFIWLLGFVFGPRPQHSAAGAAAEARDQ